MPQTSLRIVVAAVASAATVLAPAAASASSLAPSASATSFSITLTQADGITPLANTSVAVLYMQPSDANQPDGTIINLATLGSGTTDSTGTFSTVLDTSAVAPSDLGDAGDGISDAFNVMVALQDQFGSQATVEEIVTIYSSFSGLASVPLRSSSGFAPAVRQATTAIILGTKYRFTPVTPLNSGNGIEAVLNFTTSRTVQKQTQVTVAFQSSGGGGWQVGGYQLEESDRGVSAPFKVDNGYHEWIWARYKYVEIAYRLDKVWSVLHFSGDLEANNTDCCAPGTSLPIGTIDYAVPSFTPGPGGAYWFALTPVNSGWSRSSGRQEANDVNGSFYIPFAGSVGLDSLTTYASVTSVTYNWLGSGCPAGHTRVIWGHNDDPAHATRVQANCLANSLLY